MAQTHVGEYVVIVLLKGVECHLVVMPSQEVEVAHFEVFGVGSRGESKGELVVVEVAKYMHTHFVAPFHHFHAAGIVEYRLAAAYCRE